MPKIGSKSKITDSFAILRKPWVEMHKSYHENTFSPEKDGIFLAAAQFLALFQEIMVDCLKF